MQLSWSCIGAKQDHVIVKRKVFGTVRQRFFIKYFSNLDYDIYSITLHPWSLSTLEYGAPWLQSSVNKLVPGIIHAHMKPGLTQNYSPQQYKQSEEDSFASISKRELEEDKVVIEDN